MNELLKKILYSLFAVYFIVSIIGGGIQTYRLECSMAECRQYREQLKLATDRQSEIAEVVGHTSLILGETVNSVAELRNQLKAVENDYNRLYSLCFDNGNIVYNGENQKEGKNK